MIKFDNFPVFDYILNVRRQEPSRHTIAGGLSPDYSAPGMKAVPPLLCFFWVCLDGLASEDLTY